MKNLLLTASYLAAGICVAAMTPQSASAQCNYRMNDIGRPHGYLSGPCNGAAQGYSGAYPSRRSATNPRPTQNRSSKANHCDSLCQAKCQATWQRGGLPSVEACYAKWSRLNAKGTARQCEAANRARLTGQPRGC